MAPGCGWASGFGRRSCRAPGESGPDSGEVALGEILALRSLLLNLHFRAAKGEAIPEPEMRGLIERADGRRLSGRGSAWRRFGRRPGRPRRAGVGGGYQIGSGAGGHLIMAEWGRKEYRKKWPSRRPVWTWMAILLTLVFFAGMLTLEYEQSWTGAERLYLSDYLKSGTGGKESATSAGKYTLLEGVVGKEQRLLTGDEIEQIPSLDGKPAYRLTDQGVKDGISKLIG